LFEFGLQQRLFGAGSSHQEIVSADSFGVFGKAQATGGVRLRIGIKEQRVDFGGGNGRREINGSRSLAYAALLVGYRENASHSVFSESRELLRRIVASGFEMQ